MVHSMILIFVALILGSQSAYGVNKNEIIEIGDLEVEGELRKPLLDYIDSDKHLKHLLPQLAKEELLEFEQSLLRPKKDSRKKQ